VSDSVRPHRWQPTRLPRPWDYPGKNTGVGCHYLLQCMKVKSEREVAQSCPALSDPMDCSPPGFSVHGIFQARVLEWGAIAFSLEGNRHGQTGKGQKSFFYLHDCSSIMQAGRRASTMPLWGFELLNNLPSLDTSMGFSGGCLSGYSPSWYTPLLSSN